MSNVIFALQFFMLISDGWCDSSDPRNQKYKKIIWGCRLNACLAFTVGAWIILLGLINFTFHMDGLFPSVKPLLHAIFSVAQTICLLTLMTTPIFAGFIFFFSITADDFDLSTSIVKIIAMMLGHFNMLGQIDGKDEFITNTGFLILFSVHVLLR